jgi:hypothetical protein
MFAAGWPLRRIGIGRHLLVTSAGRVSRHFHETVMANTNPAALTRRDEVRCLFQERHPAPARSNDVISFQAWLTENRPDLLPSNTESSDDRYQLRPDLEGLYTE